MANSIRVLSVKNDWRMHFLTFTPRAGVRLGCLHVMRRPQHSMLVRKASVDTIMGQITILPAKPHVDNSEQGRKRIFAFFMIQYGRGI